MKMMRERRKKLFSKFKISATPIYIVALISALLPILSSSAQDNNNHQSNNYHRNHNITTNEKLNKTQAEQVREIHLPIGKCQEISSCKARNRRRDLDVGPDKYNCYCDQKCKLYDDCCIDSPWTETISKRIELGTDRIRERRSQWHCKRINNIFGDIVLRASCSIEWLQQQDDPNLANSIRRRCEYVKDRGKGSENGMRQNATNHHHDGGDNNNNNYFDDHAAQIDPIGMMMPITDLNSGITYANSYCLRCNTLMVNNNNDATATTTKRDDREVKKRNLIYWSPLLECNYNVDNDERNFLYDLISSKKGKALKYSNKRNKWIIITSTTAAGDVINNKVLQQNGNTNTNTNSSTKSTTTTINSENIDEQTRVCSIMPTIPDSVEHMIRYCKANLIRSCPIETSQQQQQQYNNIHLINRNSNNSKTMIYEKQRQAKLECEFGHQSITYSLTRKAVYYNPACAMCNNEQRIFCEPKTGRGFPAAGGPISKIVVNKPITGDRPVFAPPSESEMIETTMPTTLSSSSSSSSGNDADAGDEDELTNNAARANSHESSVSGSFSVLMDLYGQDETNPAEIVMANLSSSIDNGKQQQQQEALHQYQYQPQQQQPILQQQQCPDPQNQVFDPFYLTCRDIFCGLNHKFVDGKCVDKFKPAMVYITDVCLIISITSLALYLILYALSTFDLRPLALALAQWQFEAEQQQQQQENSTNLESNNNLSNGNNKPPASNNNNNKLSSNSMPNQFTSHHQQYLKRHSRASNEGSIISGPTSSSSSGSRHSQSLSTRGVASLACSLLAAYILFMLGHQTETGIQEKRQPICAGLAAATYYCFLVAFCWMFLLAYDIWRTLRLATCQLRGPAMHSQSTRFLSYALLALIVSAILVGLAILIDQLPPTCETNLNNYQHHYQHHQRSLENQPSTGTTGINSSNNCSSSISNWWSHFVQVYKPNFGHQPGSCWFSNRRALALFFGFPVTLIMVANLIFFLHSSYMVIRTSSRSSRAPSKSSTMSTSTSTSSHPAQLHHLNNSNSGQSKFVSLEKGLTQANNNNNDNNHHVTDFTHQNSLTTSSFVSVQTLQSHLSTGSSIGSSSANTTLSSSSANEESPMNLPTYQNTTNPTTAVVAEVGEQGSRLQPSPPQQQHLPETNVPKKHTKLDASLSSSSLATNHSSHSITSSLATKYDAHLQNLQSMMGSIVEDYRLYCRLSTIMGLTWLTGLLASLVDQSEILWYLFVILNTLQGLFIFMAFGCKRSKLSNLMLLLNYLRFWFTYRCCCCFWRSSSSSSSSSKTTNDGVANGSSNNSSRSNSPKSVHLRQDSISSEQGS